MVHPQAKPNSAHTFFAELEKRNKNVTIITQNIDGLHSIANSTNVLELHGSIHRNYCMKCHLFYPLDTIIKSDNIPVCTCGGIIKPDVVLYEENLNYNTLTKSKEMISDFLSVIGAENALKKFAAFVEKRDEANHDNRARNCMAGNADKTAIAAVKQVVALKKLEENNFKDLSEELATLARARLKNPTMSLQELATLTGVSKSCLNHRMRKLMELSGEI